MATDSVKGPASYFPPIEAKYGRPIAEWKDLIRGQSGKKHMAWATVMPTPLSRIHYASSCQPHHVRQGRLSPWQDCANCGHRHDEFSHAFMISLSRPSAKRRQREWWKDA